MKILYFENFSSCYMILGVIWQKPFEFIFGGRATVAGESQPATAWYGHRRAAVAFGQLPYAPATATTSARAF
jgi:hypothetical protein